MDTHRQTRGQINGFHHEVGHLGVLSMHEGWSGLGVGGPGITSRGAQTTKMFENLGKSGIFSTVWGGLRRAENERNACSERQCDGWEACGVHHGVVLACHQHTAASLIIKSA